MLGVTNESPPAGQDGQASRASGQDALALARAADPDRGLTLLFAPVDRRGELAGLVLLASELARIPATVHQPMPGLIRLQWWRDALAETTAGSTPAQPALSTLAPALVRGAVPLPLLIGLVDGYEPVIEHGSPEDLAGLEAFAQQTAGNLAAAMLAALGGDAALGAAAALMGQAYGMMAAMRRTAPPSLDAALVRARAAALVQRARQGLGRPPRAVLAPLLQGRLALALPADPARPRDPTLPAQLLLSWMARRP